MFFDREKAEFRGDAIVQAHRGGRRVDAGQELQGLDGHQRTDSAGYRAQHAVTGAIFELLVGFLVQAAVAGAIGGGKGGNGGNGGSGGGGIAAATRDDAAPGDGEAGVEESPGDGADGPGGRAGGDGGAGGENLQAGEPGTDPSGDDVTPGGTSSSRDGGDGVGGPGGRSRLSGIRTGRSLGGSAGRGSPSGRSRWPRGRGRSCS